MTNEATSASSRTSARPLRRRAALALGVAIAAVALGACTDDEADEDAQSFCTAAMAAEQAVASESPDADAAVEAALDAAPDDLRPAVEDVVANAERGAGDPAFDEPYAEVIDFMQERCEVHDLSVTTSEYAYDGLPEDIEAGPTIISAANEGDEPHAVFLARIVGDATAEELVAMPEDELFGSIEVVNGTFLEPGVRSFVPADLDPGRYLLICPIPDDAGTSHATHGMFEELTVG